MKKMFFLLVIVFLSFSFLSAQEDPTTQNSVPEPARISFVEGSAKLNAEPAEINLPLTDADQIITEDGRVEIGLGKGDYIRLDENTKLRFIEFTKDSTKIFLEAGAVYINVHAQIVDVEAANFFLTVKNELIKISSTQEGAVASKPRTPDEFNTLWDEAREQELAPAPESESGNLPEELNEYESELSRNGEWRDHERYGHVWVPRVESYWRPYYRGYWRWTIFGWFWVSYEPFGWCTYHYGRWHWDPYWASWYWIPVIGWGPAWVHWYGWGNYWGWCPMWHDQWYYNRYYNSYYGRGYGRGWSAFVRKDQLQRRDIHVVAARRSELQTMGQIGSIQLLRKSIAPTPTSISRSSSQSQSVGSIQNRKSPSQLQSASNAQKAQISRKSSPTKIQGYPSRLSTETSRTRRLESSRSSSSEPRSLTSRSSRSSYSPTQRFISPRSQTSRFSSSRSSSRSFSAPRLSSPRSSVPSRSPSPSRSSSSPRRKN